MSAVFNERKIANKEKLPVGIQDFESMRREGYLYVDKTRHISRMVTEGKFYFLSRPRRFGKSVLVTTLKCLFQGKKDLFKGLWIAEYGNWVWQEHPVVLLDFTEIANDTPDTLKLGLGTYLASTAEEYEIDLKTPLLLSKFRELILQLFRKTGRSVAILIDEYDKPIIDHLGRGNQELDIAKANRDVLKRFFGVLKSVAIAPALRFIFLTGITQFSKVSIFSELNNLDDISMNDNYAGILGYTQQEMETNFGGYIDALAEKLGWSYDQVKAKLAAQYDGYRFSEHELRVSNPFSILKAFSAKKFNPYWFETATPTFLINLLRRTRYDFTKIEGLKVSQSIFTTFDIDNLFPEALLFQTGYITIKDVHNGVYTLDYPNQEVKIAFSESLLLALTKGATRTTSSHVLQLAAYLQDENFEAFFETITAIFASIPYDIETKRDEAYFHTLFYLMISASGTDAQSSVLTCRGRIDLVVQFPDKVYIIEFKCNQGAETAIQQIQENGYAERYRNSGKRVILMGIDFSMERRNLADWKVLQ